MLGSTLKIGRFAIAASAVGLLACSAILGLTDPTLDNSIGGGDGGTSPDGNVVTDGGGSDAPNTCGANLTNDPKNCGVCGHDCLGGACSAGSCQPVLVVADPNGIAPFFMAENTDTIFFSSAHTETGVSNVASVLKSGIDGSAPYQVIGDFNDVGGGNTEDVYPYQVGLTSTNLWVSLNAELAINNNFQGGVTSCGFDAGSCPDNAHLLIPQIDSQAVATDGTVLVYGYADLLDAGFGSEQDKVKQFVLAAGTSSTTNLLDIGTAETIAFIAIDNQNVYVGGANGIFVVNETGSPHSQLTTIEAEQLAVFNTSVYFTSAPTGGPATVQSVPTTGGAAATVLAQGSFLTNPTGIAVDTNYLYFADEGDKSVPTAGFIYRCPLSGCGEDGGAATVLSTGAASGGNPRTILANDSDAIYWGTRNGSLWKLAK